VTVLAIDGGKPVRTDIYPPWPFYDADEIKSAVKVLQSGKVNYWTGKEGRLFEKEFSDYINASHAVTVMNGSVALEAALIALGIGNGDEVIVTPRSYIASASCAVMRNAKPVFADVDPDSQNITSATIEKAITPRSRAIIAVHLAGWPCEMDPILALAIKHNLYVIEDCAQALGASYKGKQVGSFGDIATFSFCQDKIITTGGEGGMVTTNNYNFWSKIWSYKDHGKNYEKIIDNNHPGPEFKWLHDSFGTNWRMTEIQATIGRKQLRKLDAWLNKRRNNAAILTKEFLKIPSLRVTAPPRNVEHAYYKYYVFLKPEMLKPGWNQNKVIMAINAEGIPCYSGSCSEIYLEKAFGEEKLRPALNLPIAKQLGETSMMFLVHPTLSDSDMHDAAEAVKKVMSAAGKP